MKKTFLTISLVIAFVSASIFSCKKKSDPAPTPSAPATTTGGTTSGTTTPTNTVTTTDINSSNRAVFTLDGVAKSYIANGSGILSGSGTSGGGTGATIYSTSIDDGTNNILGISKGTLVYSTSYPTNTQFKAFFPINTTSFVYSPNGGNGIEITMDIAGVEWSTSKGTGNQTGSTFFIQQRSDNPDVNNFYLKVYAIFNCKVYDGSGNSKTITNGTYIGNFGNI